jgi:hypothetical protein
MVQAVEIRIAALSLNDRAFFSILLELGDGIHIKCVAIYL